MCQHQYCKFIITDLQGHHYLHQHLLFNKHFCIQEVDDLLFATPFCIQEIDDLLFATSFCIQDV